MVQFDSSAASWATGSIMTRLDNFLQEISGQAALGLVPAASTTPASRPFGGGRAGSGPPPSSHALPQQAHQVQTTNLHSHSWAAPAATLPRQHHVPRQLPSGAALEFAERLGLDAGQAAFLEALQEDVLIPVIQSFDPTGTKDGNVWGRLFGFVRSVWAQRLGVYDVGFMKGLSEESQRVVILKFDPNRQKDGNTATRLERFVSSVALRAAGFGEAGSGTGRGHGGALHASLDSTQQAQCRGGPGLATTVHAATARGPAVAPPSSALEVFVMRWGLNWEAAAFLEALPESVLVAVCESFNAHGTKDGNIWGRLFGFVRSIWVQRLNVDTPARNYLFSLPEDAQRLVMMHFDPDISTDGGGFMGQFLAIAEQALPQPAADPQPLVQQTAYVEQDVVQFAQTPQQSVPVVPADDYLNGGDEMLSSFVARCGLDANAMEFLRSLHPDVMATVISDFRPSGTKDGNVFARLQGFTRAVQGRHKRKGPGPWDGGISADRNVRPCLGVC